MGSTLSCIHGTSVSRQVQHPIPPAPARIIAADGSLKELPLSPAVSDVLAGAAESASSFFMCNSDVLYFNEHPHALAAGELLRAGQMYFVLPAAMLGRPLSSADMAALAARASAALAAKKTPPPLRRGRSGRKPAVRVVPVQEEGEEDGKNEGVFFYEKINEQTLGDSAVFVNAARNGNKVTAAVEKDEVVGVEEGAEHNSRRS